MRKGESVASMPVYHRKKTAASNAITDLIRAVLHMSATAERQGSKLTKHLGVTSARWQAMGQLHWSEERMTVSQLARALGLSRQAVQRLASGMAGDGVVAFVENPADKRAMHVVLTKRGSEIHSAALEREWEWTNRLAAHFTVKDLVRTKNLIAAVTERMEFEPIL